MRLRTQTDADALPDGEGGGSWWDTLRDRALTTMLGLLCLIVFLAAPLVATGSTEARVALEVMLLALSVLVVLISRTRLIAGIAAGAMLVALAGSLCNFFLPSPSLFLSAQIGMLTGSIIAAYLIGSAVFAPGEVTPHRVLGAIVLYLDLGVTFSGAYRLAWNLLPTALGGIPVGTPSWQAAGTILYFSFVTLTSVGYGDVVPIHPIVRSLANLEAIIGQLFPATLLARLVTLELTRRRL